jgi:ribulose-5-phosphate 4-epimerase/fuculose-1-phosphate aldolase
MSDYVALPTFDSIEDERNYGKRHLAIGCRLLAMHGFESGGTGHVTMRDPELADHFWLNPLGIPLATVTSRDVVLVGPDGTVKGDRPANPAGIALSAAILRARPEIVGIAHAHTIPGSAVSAIGEPLAPITQDACAFYGDHAVYDEYLGSVESPEKAARVVEGLGRNKAVIMRHHGLLTVGHSIDSAVWWLIAMDRACHVQLLVGSATTGRTIDSSQAEAAYSSVGSESAARFSFRLLYDLIVSQQPDLLDD